MSKKRNQKANLIKTLWIFFAIILFLVASAELLMHRHPHFAIDAIPLFEAWFGFGACVVIVLVSKLLGFLVKAPESYYHGGKKHD
jgi:hypothetical protein